MNHMLLKINGVITCQKISTFLSPSPLVSMLTKLPCTTAGALAGTGKESSEFQFTYRDTVDI